MNEAGIESDGPAAADQAPRRIRPLAADTPDVLLRTISRSGSVAVKVVVANGLLSEALSLRPYAATAGNALGRAMMGGLLIAVGSAPDDADEANVESVQIQIRGNGPLGAVTAIADSRARVRGTVAAPGTERLRPDGSPDIAGAVGLGPLNVVRHRPRWRSPYTGTVPLVSGEIAGDLTLYLTESEQTPSAMGLGISFGAHMDTVAGAGFLVQALPDADPDELLRVEENVGGLPGLATMLDETFDPAALIERLLDGIGARDFHSMQPRFACPCSRDRARRTLSLLARSELEELIAEDAEQEVICDFCGRAYRIGARELGELLESMPAPGA